MTIKLRHSETTTEDLKNDVLFQTEKLDANELWNSAVEFFMSFGHEEEKHLE